MQTTRLFYNDGPKPTSQIIYGGNGNDSLQSLGGEIRGDAGTDNLYCAAGSEETVWFDRDKGADVVYVFRTAEDVLRIDGDEFGIGGLINYDEFYVRASDHAGNGFKAQFIFQDDINVLYFDPDGVGSDEAFAVMTFVGSDAPKFSDFDVI